MTDTLFIQFGNVYADHLVNLHTKQMNHTTYTI